MRDHLRHLEQRGFAWVRDGFTDRASAFELAQALVGARAAAAGLAPLTVIGEFVLPPPEGPPSRDFQTLHFDFGLPLEPRIARDVGRFTALHVPVARGPVAAVTRIVPLAALLRQRTWPSQHEVLARLMDYGRTHGAWDEGGDYLEGSLARVVEAAAGAPVLPSVRTENGFLCGLEFDTLDSEVAFFAQRGLRLDEVQVDVALSPGELLVFDNFAVAHGRRGVRRPGELHQWVFGERAVGVVAQRALRDEVLASFAGGVGGDRLGL